MGSQFCELARREGDVEVAGTVDVTEDIAELWLHVESIDVESMDTLILSDPPALLSVDKNGGVEVVVGVDTVVDNGHVVVNVDVSVVIGFWFRF